MKIISTFKSVSALASIAMVTFACSTTNLATHDLQRLQSLRPDSTQALVYVVRPSVTGAVVKFGVTCDDINIGSTNGKQFIYAFVTPGVHNFVSKSENKSELFLETEANKTYYILQKVKMGLLMARVGMEMIDEPTGKVMLAKCKLSGDCPAYSQAK